MASAAPPDHPRLQLGAAKLRHRIAELEVFHPDQVENRNDPAITKLSKAIEETLVEIFGADTEEYRQYSAAKAIDTAPYMLGGTPIGLVRHGLEQGKAAAIALLQQAAAALEQRIGASPPAPPPVAPKPVTPEPAPVVAPPPPAAAPPPLAKPAAPPLMPAAAPAPVAATASSLLVVHSAGDAAGEEVAQFLGKTELGKVARYESAASGPTDVEALERHAAIGFVVVVMPPEEAASGSSILRQPGGRQKAMAELFYFIGKLGRAKVCVLSKGEGEAAPVAGMVCAPYDRYEGWQKVVLRGLEAAGYRIDWGKALR
jgi:Predicted nucleotide-binding protein containing TIR-like domain